jgi:hypothetical protein
MKSLHGLLVAMFLGLAGAVLNWFYLEQRSHDFDKVPFIGVREGVTIRRGEVLTEDKLVQVDIPRSATGQLKDFAYYYKDLATVLGQSPKREISGGELLLRQDMKMPPPELNFTAGPNERALGIPVDTSTFVPSLVIPGEFEVYFLVPHTQATFGPPISADGSPTPAGREPQGPDFIGPFKILALGNRLGSPGAQAAAHLSSTQENVMTISVQVDGDKLEPEARKLVDMMQRMNTKQLGVLVRKRGGAND